MATDPSSLLHPSVLELARNRGMVSFTPVQAAAFPKIVAGKSVLLMAPTGFGKTEAAMLPILSALAKAKSDAGSMPDGVQVLYITPLRALNRDMVERLTFFCKQLKFRLGVRHGDTTAYERVKQKELPPHILVTTPESLGALLVAGMRDSLKNVRFVVVDEVHELAYSKRGVQLNLALCRLSLLAKFQRIGLSATVAAPKDVAAFLGTDVEVVDCSALRAMHLDVVHPKAGVAVEGLSRTTAARLGALVDLVKSHRKTLVFVNTRFMAEALGSLLRPLLGEDFAVHHSSLSKEARLEVETAFKAGALKALVCTSSLELGMDIGEVDLVVQVGSPRQATRLIQRVGRSGHKHHLVPKGVVVATDDLDEVEAQVLVTLAKARQLEPQRLRKMSLDVLAHQITGLAMDFGRIRLQGAVDVFRGTGRTMATVDVAANGGDGTSQVDAPKQAAVIPGSALYPVLDFALARKVIEQVASEGLIAFDGEFVEPNSRTRFYYYENLSTIADLKKFFVKNAESNKNVALLDEAFVSNYLQPGAAFIARGRTWKVLSMVEDEIVVEPARDASAAIPDWVGEEIPVERSVSAMVAKQILEGGAQGGNGTPTTGVKQAHGTDVADGVAQGNGVAGALDAGQIRQTEWSKKQCALFEPNSGTFVLECQKNMAILHSFWGHKANAVIAVLISGAFSARGKSVRARANAYGVVLEFSKVADPDAVVAALRSFRGTPVSAILEKQLPDGPMFASRFVHVAKRFGFLRKDRDYDAVSVKRLAALSKDTVIGAEVLAELLYDKLDVAGAQEALDSVAIKTVSFSNWSPLAKSALDAGGFSELYAPSEPTEAVLKTFAEDLMQKRVVLHCDFCKQRFSRQLSNLPEPLLCIHCQSPRLFPEEYLSKPEQAKVASLVASYGRKAVLAFSTYGVGPEGATRVLGRLHKSDSDMFYDLLQSQKDFIRTKRFWKAN
ncbi:DEAD/DEAH box helicase [Candidatus Micrarchaeota archaeon]|nr:DEAD/DEAH box helicase [Candidatus Micrarchaeota archaeon]